MKIKKISLYVFLFAALTFSFYFFNLNYVSLQDARRKSLAYENRKYAWIGLTEKLLNEIKQFKGEAGVVIKDLETGWEFSYGQESLFPSASLAKIPVMSACFLAARDGKIRLKRSVTLKSYDKLTGSGMLKDMHAGISFTLEELIGLMIYDSDNTATGMITNIMGIDYLNEAFKTLGLRDTNLSRKIADYHSRNKGIENFTTAKDTAYILENIYRKTLIDKGVSEKCLSLLKLCRTNDRIPRYLPAELAVAHKTGLERGVCHDAGIVYTPKGDFLICVLTKHANPDSVLAKEFIAKLALYTYTYFAQL
ncbi:MAG: serine hydrolase [Candidatus Omnitrophota bacterium]